MADVENRISGLPGPAQLKLFLLVFGASVALLAAGYYFFLRTEYAVLYADLRPADASAIVAELDRRGIAYDLRDGGSTIAVPADGVASARLAIAGSDVPSRGAVGFELFNESDMGLTDFAQRINYQRALQGELARTIMTMGGIESARVHLALPERSLFRGNRSQPTAAVTVIPQRGRPIDGARVAGIQRLVAAAVPDLTLGNVVVLDGVGRVISRTEAADSFLPSEMEEQQAVQSYFRARARTAVQNVLPELRFDVRVSVLGETEALGGSWTGAAEAAPAAAAERRNFRLRLVVLTEASLPATERELVRNAVTGAVALDENAGDALLFTVAPLAGTAAPPPDVVAPVVPSATLGEPAVRRRPAADGWPSLWTLIALLAGLGALGLILRSRGPAMAAEQRDALVLRIRNQLRLTQEGGDVRA